jgi:hypothetical protein
MTGIRLAQPGDADEVVRVLADAFVDDPLLTPMWRAVDR